MEKTIDFNSKLPKNEVKNELKKVIPLKTPFTFEESEYTEIILDFTKLNGEKLMEAEDEFIADGNRSSFLQTNQRYVGLVASKCVGMPPEFIKALPAKTFTKVILATQAFLLDTD